MRACCGSGYKWRLVSFLSQAGFGAARTEEGCGVNEPERRLLREAESLASMSELARFNAERARLLGGKPPGSEERMPLPYSGVGGDLPEKV